MAVIKEYEAKTGKVTIIRYDNNEYRVAHSKGVEYGFTPYWTTMKKEAIYYAQFLTRY